MTHGSPRAGSDAGSLLGLLRSAAATLAALPRPVAGLAVALWMAGTWWLSSDTRDVPGSGPLSAFLANLAHAPLFGGLAALVWRALAFDAAAPPTRAAAVAAFALAVGWAVTDEWHQAFVPGRQTSVLDLATDAAGAAGALWLLALAWRPDTAEAGARRGALAVVLACAAAAGAATCAGLP
jgi:hypothetical protein